MAGSLDFIVSLTFFWNLSPKSFSVPSQNNELPPLEVKLRNKAVNTLCLLKYHPLMWHCPTSITHCSTFLRWSFCAQRWSSGSIMFVKFSCALISDLSQMISSFFPASSHRVFVQKGNYLVLDYSLIYSL